MSKTRPLMSAEARAVSPAMSPREELAARMLPVAAHLAAIVHGDGGPEDVAEALDGLDADQMTALVVVLAGLVDVDQPLSTTLAHVGETSMATVREIADWHHDQQDWSVPVDEVAVARYAAGEQVRVNRHERLAAIARACERGVSFPELDRWHGLPLGATASFIDTERQRYRREGTPFPQMATDRPVRLSEEDRAEVRRAYAADGISQNGLALRYGVSRTMISRIVSGQRAPSRTAAA